MRIEEAIRNIEDSILAAYPQIKGIPMFRPNWGRLGVAITEFVIYYQMYGVPSEYNGNILEWFKAELLPILEERIKYMTSRRKRILANKIECPQEVINEEWYKFYLIREFAILTKHINVCYHQYFVKSCEMRKQERDANRRSDQSPA